MPSKPCTPARSPPSPPPPTESCQASSAAPAATPSGAPKKSRVLRRKTDHSVIERRRREKINEKLVLLQTVVPACQRECCDLVERRFESVPSEVPDSSSSSSSSAATRRRKVAQEKTKRAKEEMVAKMRSTMVLEKLCIISHTVDYVLDLQKEIESLRGRCQRELRAGSVCASASASASASPTQVQEQLGQTLAARYRDVHPSQPRNASAEPSEPAAAARRRSDSLSSDTSSAPPTPPHSPEDPLKPQRPLNLGARLEALLDGSTSARNTCAHVLKKRRLHWGSDNLRRAAVKVPKALVANPEAPPAAGLSETEAKERDVDTAEQHCEECEVAGPKEMRVDASNSTTAVLCCDEAGCNKHELDCEQCDADASMVGSPCSRQNELGCEPKLDATITGKRKVESLAGLNAAPCFHHRHVRNSCCRFDSSGAECEDEAGELDSTTVDVQAEIASNTSSLSPVAVHARRPSLPTPSQLFPHLSNLPWSSRSVSQRRPLHLQFLSHPYPHVHVHGHHQLPHQTRLAPLNSTSKHPRAEIPLSVAKTRPLSLYSSGTSSLPRSRYGPGPTCPSPRASTSSSWQD